MKLPVLPLILCLLLSNLSFGQKTTIGPLRSETNLDTSQSKLASWNNPKTLEISDVKNSEIIYSVLFEKLQKSIPLINFSPFYCTNKFKNFDFSNIKYNKAGSHYYFGDNISENGDLEKTDTSIIIEKLVIYEDMVKYGVDSFIMVDEYGNAFIDPYGYYQYHYEDKTMRIREYFNNFSFIENWTLDEKIGKMEKEILAVQPLFSFYSENISGFINFAPLYPLAVEKYSKPIIPTTISKGKIIEDKNLLFEEIVYDVFYPTYRNQGNEDIFTFYLNQDDKTKMLLFLFNSIKNKKITPYLYIDGKISHDFPVKHEDIIDAFSFETELSICNMEFINNNTIRYDYSDTIFRILEDDWGYYYRDDEGNYLYDTVIEKVEQQQVIIFNKDLYDFDFQNIADPYYYIIKNKPPLKTEYLEKINSKVKETIIFDALEDFYGIRFYETWYFDKEIFSFYKRVNGMALIFRKENYSLDKENLFEAINPSEPIIKLVKPTIIVNEIIPVYFQFNNQK